MVGNEIEHQTEIFFCAAHSLESASSPPRGVPCTLKLQTRSPRFFLTEVGQCLRNSLRHSWLVRGLLPARRFARRSVTRSNRQFWPIVEFVIRDIIELPPVPISRQFRQPDTGIDLEQKGIERFGIIPRFWFEKEGVIQIIKKQPGRLKCPLSIWTIGKS